MVGIEDDGRGIEWRDEGEEPMWQKLQREARDVRPVHEPRRKNAIVPWHP